MKKLREMTMLGDPRINIQLADSIRLMLIESAKKNRRSMQDEFIKRMALSFYFNDQFEVLEPELSNKPEISDNLQRYSQALPLEILEEIKQVCFHKSTSVELEVASRLLATFIHPQVFGFHAVEQGILNKKFSLKEATAECDRFKNGWLYLYEMEKLRLFLQFQDKLPRKIKEGFILIDVKEATKKIKAELKKNKSQD